MTPKAVNGHVIIAQCKNPANKMVGGIEIHTKELNGMFTGTVIAIDETEGLKHICKVGDIAFVQKSFICGEVEIDGGEIVIVVREGMLGAIVEDVSPEREAFMPHVERPASESASNKITTPPKQKLQIVQG